MQISRLRHRVSLQRLLPGSPAQDAGGVPDEQWTTLFTCWADVAPLRGRELVAAQQVASEVTGTVRIRYRSDFQLTSKDRVLFDTRVYDVVSVVNHDERNREVILYVRENVNDG